MELIVKYSKSVYYSIGTKEKLLCESEYSNRIKYSYFCLSATELSKGTILNEQMIQYKQPGGSILPKDFESIIGKSLKRNINKDHIFGYEDF